MEHPEKYTCQVFTSAKSTAWTYTPSEGATGVTPPPPQEIKPDTNTEHRSEAAPSFNEVRVGPSKLADKDTPYLEPRAEPARAVDLTVPTKRVVRRQQSGRRQQQQPGPFDVIASLLTGNW